MSKKRDAIQADIGSEPDKPKPIPKKSRSEKTAQKKSETVGSDITDFSPVTGRKPPAAQPEDVLFSYTQTAVGKTTYLKTANDVAIIVAGYMHMRNTNVLRGFMATPSAATILETFMTVLDNGFVVLGTNRKINTSITVEKVFVVMKTYPQYYDDCLTVLHAQTISWTTNGEFLNLKDGKNAILEKDWPSAITLQLALALISRNLSDFPGHPVIMTSTLSACAEDVSRAVTMLRHARKARSQAFKSESSSSSTSTSRKQCQAAVVPFYFQEGAENAEVSTLETPALIAIRTIQNDILEKLEELQHAIKRLESSEVYQGDTNKKT